MKTPKTTITIPIGLLIIITLLIWQPLTAFSFPQGSNDNGTGKEGVTGSINMQSVSGRVVQTMDSGGYTYALVEDNGINIWVALPVSNIRVGNEITCKPGMVMNNFSSSSLNHTFKHIVFSGGIISSSQGDANPVENSGPEKTKVLPKVKEPENWKDF